MAGGQPAVWVFFSGVLGRRPSYSLPFGCQATSWDSMFLLYTYLISGDEAASFSATGWGDVLLGRSKPMTCETAYSPSLITFTGNSLFSILLYGKYSH